MGLLGCSEACGRITSRWMQSHAFCWDRLHHAQCPERRFQLLIDPECHRWHPSQTPHGQQTPLRAGEKGERTALHSARPGNEECFLSSLCH